MGVVELPAGTCCFTFDRFVSALKPSEQFGTGCWRSPLSVFISWPFLPCPLSGPLGVPSCGGLVSGPQRCGGGRRAWGKVMRWGK